MGIEASNILHNKLGSAAERTNSENGPNFAVGGAPDDRPCKFDDGTRIDANTEIVQINNTPAQFDFSKGIIDFWIQLTVDVVNGRTGGGQRPRVMTWWLDATHYMQWSFHNTVGLIWNTRNGATNLSWNNTNSSLDASANTPFHLAFVWSGTGIGATSHRRRMYIGNTLAGAEISPFVDVDMTSAFFVIGLLYNGSYLSNGEIIIDNIKWDPFTGSDEATILKILANKDNEGWPSAGGF